MSLLHFLDFLDLLKCCFHGPLFSGVLQFTLKFLDCFLCVLHGILKVMYFKRTEEKIVVLSVLNIYLTWINNVSFHYHTCLLDFTFS